MKASKMGLFSLSRSGVGFRAFTLAGIIGMLRRLWGWLRSWSGDMDWSLMDEEIDMKDVYAQFGLTFSHGCNVEGVLANLILTADFVKRMYDESKKAGKPIYDRYTMGKKLEEYLAEQHAKTFGQLISRKGGIKEFLQLDPALEKRVDEAKRRRDYLAHNFWRERGQEAISIRRRDKVFADLQADQAFFDELAKDLEEVAMDEVRKIGLDAEKLKVKLDASVKAVQQELAR
jgi:hypothetical protein